jgi:hypothetical protein
LIIVNIEDSEVLLVLQALSKPLGTNISDLVIVQEEHVQADVSS